MEIPPYKLRIKIGDAEFEAEGPQDVIQKAFEQFLAAAEKAPSVQTKAPPTDPTKIGNLPKGHDDSPIEPTVLQRMFNVDAKKGIVSLRVLPPDGPNKGADAAILIIYGAYAQLHSNDLRVTRLKTGLTKSGIQVNRIDRMMIPHNQIIIKGGSGVGGRYSLNNQGIVQAEDLIRKIFS